MRKGKQISILLIVACVLTGCIDQMPELTDEQSDLISEYAAGLMLKYSPIYDYRLATDAELSESEETSQVESTVENIEKPGGQPETKPSDTQKEDEFVVSASTEASEEDSKTIQVSWGNKKQDVDYYANAKETDLAGSVIHLPNGVSLKYKSYEICSEYPVGSLRYGFAVTADDGKRLLVMHFTLTNNSGKKVSCDLFEQNITFRLNVNDAGYKAVSSTMLINDMTTFIEEIGSGKSEDVVVVTQISQKSDSKLESVLLYLESKGKKGVLKLK